MTPAEPVARPDDALKLHRNTDSGEVSIAPLPTQTDGKPTISRSGTGLAINYNTLGVAVHSPPDPAGRGGARNHSDRESHELSVAQVGNLTEAVRHAGAIGLPLNRMTTIHWEAAGLPLEAMSKATGRFIDRMTKAITRHGGKTAWLWVHEGGEQEGGHCHLLAHVPPNIVPVLTRLQRGWLGQITGRPYSKGVICSKPIGGRLGIEVNNPDLHAANLNTVLAYVLKGASQEAVLQYGLTRLKPGGRIIGKRCGVSQNIGMKSRRNRRF